MLAEYNIKKQNNQRTENWQRFYQININSLLFDKSFVRKFSKKFEIKRIDVRIKRF